MQSRIKKFEFSGPTGSGSRQSGSQGNACVGTGEVEGVRQVGGCHGIRLKIENDEIGLTNVPILARYKSRSTISNLFLGANMILKLHNLLT